MNHYDTLLVDRKASFDEIKKQFKKLQKQYHPDRNGGCENFVEKSKRLNEAYAILKDEDKRVLYDFSLRLDNTTQSRNNEWQSTCTEPIFPSSITFSQEIPFSGQAKVFTFKTEDGFSTDRAKLNSSCSWMSAKILEKKNGIYKIKVNVDGRKLKSLHECSRLTIQHQGKDYSVAIKVHQPVDALDLPRLIFSDKVELSINKDNPSGFQKIKISSHNKAAFSGPVQLTSNKKWLKSVSGSTDDNRTHEILLSVDKSRFKGLSKQATLFFSCCGQAFKIDATLKVDKIEPSSREKSIKSKHRYKEKKSYDKAQYFSPKTKIALALAMPLLVFFFDGINAALLDSMPTSLPTVRKLTAEQFKVYFFYMTVSSLCVPFCYSLANNGRRIELKDALISCGSTCLYSLGLMTIDGSSSFILTLIICLLVLAVGAYLTIIAADESILFALLLGIVELLLLVYLTCNWIIPQFGKCFENLSTTATSLPDYPQFWLYTIAISFFLSLFPNRISEYLR